MLGGNRSVSDLENGDAVITSSSKRFESAFIKFLSDPDRKKRPDSQFRIYLSHA
jgi:hypothetical protein